MNRDIEDLLETGPDAPSATAAEPLPDASLKAILEVLLFASEEPVSLEDVLAIVGEDRAGEVAAALDRLEAEFASRSGGLRVQRLAGGFRLTTDPELAPFVRELVRSRNRQRLSRAALETLAIVAYKQPITSPEIQEIRGVNPSAILSSLLERRLVRILGRKRVVGKPFLYGTTQDFLVRFGLNSLEDLPSLEEFESLLAPEAAEGDPPARERPTGDAEAPAADRSAESADAEEPGEDEGGPRAPGAGEA